MESKWPSRSRRPISAFYVKTEKEEEKKEKEQEKRLAGYVVRTRNILFLCCRHVSRLFTKRSSDFQTLIFFFCNRVINRATTNRNRILPSLSAIETKRNKNVIKQTK